MYPDHHYDAATLGLAKAAINACMVSRTDRDIVRFATRQPLFVERGLTAGSATKAAARLALRDQDGDHRRMCLKCSNLLTPTRCKKGIAVVHVLQRCSRFNFKVPQ